MVLVDCCQIIIHSELSLHWVFYLCGLSNEIGVILLIAYDILQVLHQGPYGIRKVQKMGRNMCLYM